MTPETWAIRQYVAALEAHYTVLRADDELDDYATVAHIRSMGVIARAIRSEAAEVNRRASQRPEVNR